MVRGRSLFMGDSEIDQLFYIFRVLGTPDSTSWVEVERLPDYQFSFPKWMYNEEEFRKKMHPLDEEGFDLIKEMLRYQPESRYTAKSALAHRYLQHIPSDLEPVYNLITVSNAQSNGDRDLEQEALEMMNR
ncbi:unnamed protein product, partial [Mesorhabditis belari]|uniref:cyclin-dependent kinase n=1 Tax=Mesorhabditis belari TaxID=2138241 RepID=A0AAF3EVV2_9BILA